MAGVVDGGGVEPGCAALDGAAQPDGVLGWEPPAPTLEAGDLLAVRLKGGSCAASCSAVAPSGATSGWRRPAPRGEAESEPARRAQTGQGQPGRAGRRPPRVCQACC
jgi:hypothetical protein